MPFNRRFATIIVALILVLATQLTALAAITVIPEPGTDPAKVALVQKTVDTFNTILDTEMGVTLDNDVRVFICPTRESYRDVLRRELGFSPDAAEKQSTLTGGFSNDKARAVVIKLDTAGNAAAGRAYFVTAHELFHQVENQLAGTNKRNSYYWLKEGGADLTGAVVAEKNGHQSLEKWKLDRINVLRKADRHASPQEIISTDLARWTKLIEDKMYPYQMSDLMVFYLMNQTKTGGYRAITDYFRLLGQGVPNAAAFSRAFGLPPADMVAGFQTWFAAVSTQAATIEVIAGPEVAAEYLADFNQGVALTRQFFQDTWGGDLKNMMRFVLVAGKPAYAAALVKEFGMSETEAQQKVKNSSWTFAGSTTVYDTTALSTKRQRLFSVSGSLARRFASEAAPQKSLEQLYWLATGSGDAVAAHIVEISGAYTKEQYRSAWLTALGKLPAYPALAELSSAAGVEQARAGYSPAAVSGVVRLATLYLLDKHGPAALNAWFKAVKDTGSAEVAFQRAFGTTVAQFYDEFSAYLSANVRKAS